MNTRNFRPRITKWFSVFVLLSLLTVNLGIVSFAKAQAPQNNSSQPGLMSEVKGKVGEQAANAILTALTQEAKLTSSDGAVDDFFGSSVAFSGDTIVIGAIGDDIGSTVDQGSVYVFVKPSAGWEATSTFTAKLTAPSGDIHQYFGKSVAISGDTIVIGAPYGTGNNNEFGSAYVFVKPLTGWETTSNYAAKLTASDGKAGDNFGWSVAISGDTVVVGAPAHVNENLTLNRGAAYVYDKPASGWQTTSSYTAKLIAFNRPSVDYFGHSVAVDGNTIAVGTLYDTLGAFPYKSSVYVFVKPSTGWGTVSDYTVRLPIDSISDINNGGAIAMSNDTIVFGANIDSLSPSNTQGSAYVFVKPTAGWATATTYTAKLTASDGANGDNFGWSVTTNGDVIVVGARFAGVYVYEKPATGWVTTSNFNTKLAEPIADFGFGVAIAGNKIAVGAPRDNIGANTRQGSAFVYSVSSTPPIDCTPNDPLYSRQWDMEAIDLVGALNQFPDCKVPSINIAVIDTGIDIIRKKGNVSYHPELIGRVIDTESAYKKTGVLDVDKDGHGTHVSGTIAAIQNNNIGIAGIHPSAMLNIYKLCARMGNCLDNITLANMIMSAVDKGARVINLSIGSNNDIGGFIERAIQYAGQQNPPVIVVAAAPETSFPDAIYPATYSLTYDNVIAVTSSTVDDKLATYAITGNYLTIAAPGGQGAGKKGNCLSSVDDCILSLYKHGTLTELQGTSMAAPHVTGVVALMLSVNPNLSACQVRSTLIRTVSAFSAPANGFPGNGILNASKAVQAVKQGNVDCISLP